jgi:hypothetical protein
MATSKAPSPRAETPRTTILLKGFPLAVHREMKAVAARAGIRLSDAYAQACAAFLAGQLAPRKGKRP